SALRTTTTLLSSSGVVRSRRNCSRRSSSFATRCILCAEGDVGGGRQTQRHRGAESSASLCLRFSVKPSWQIPASRGTRTPYPLQRLSVRIESADCHLPL